jgi:hypothetical protein
MDPYMDGRAVGIEIVKIDPEALKLLGRCYQFEKWRLGRCTEGI